MANGVFIIQELRRVGGVLVGSQNPDGGERFEWTADPRPVGTQTGGARAAPLQPWTIGGKLRTVKSWYGGARTPSEQVLGPSFDDQTFRGSLDDRYNFVGYAVDTKRRFEEMCQRGGFARISFQQEAWEGIITEWNFDYKRSWDIPYTFKFSVHGRPEDRSVEDRSPPTVLTTAQIFDNVDIGVQAILDTHNTMPDGLLGGSLADDSTKKLSLMAASRDQLADTLDQNDVRAQSSPFSKIAALLRSVNSTASDLVDELAFVRSDTDVIVRTAKSALDFEAWSRSMRFQSRIILGQTRKAAQEVEERSEPKTDRIYTPYAGELLYSVSTRFYGTPHAWALIANRNRLRYFKLRGDEILMIPERGDG